MARSWEKLAEQGRKAAEHKSRNQWRLGESTIQAVHIGPGGWLLIPADGGGPPRLDGHPAPLSSGWLRLPVEWIRHAAGTARRAS